MNDLEALRTMHFDAWCGMLLVISGRSRIVVRKRQAYCRTRPLSNHSKLRLTSRSFCPILHTHFPHEFA